ncbi:hypothetical protein PN36_19380 [Candidatus Thiomargarita nelsonii]|uniref:Uncharacterized protein n=1 Tax=Candidatus Thiomargarita nelsonii TaxID=1003181 RepID=A0A0A6PLV0_9GAMM|nr:hypothetical protein PN36_19380 [Candidatus Thiomargarita nelsonii]
MSKLNIESELYSPVLSPEIKMALHKEHQAMREIIKKEIEEGIQKAFKSNTVRIDSLECDINKTREDLKHSNRFQQGSLPVEDEPYRQNGMNRVKSLQKYSIPIILVLLVSILVFFIWPEHESSPTPTKSSLPVSEVNPPEWQPALSSEVETETSDDQIISSSEPIPMFGDGNRTKPVYASANVKEDKKAQVNLKSDHPTYVAALDDIINTETAPEHSKLKALIQKLYTAEGLEGTRHSVSQAQQKRRFKNYVEKSSYDVYLIRGLFEYIAALSCLDCGEKILVDLLLSDIKNPILTTLNQKLPEPDRFAPLPVVKKNNKEFKEFMAAVILLQLKD